jgi:tol-pal system protein YbgF
MREVDARAVGRAKAVSAVKADCAVWGFRAARVSGRASSDSRPLRWLDVSALGSLWALPLALAAACSHGPSQTDRAIAQLRADLARLSVDQGRLLARVAAVEAAQRPPSAKGAIEPAVASPVGNPPAQTDRMARTDGPGQDDAAAAPPAARIGANREYEAALALFKAKSYDAAIEGLTAFLVRYPDHPHTENAMYWRGEAFQAKGDYNHAVKEYEDLIARFPFGNRTAEALLGLGTCEQRLGQRERADEAFAQLRERYPKSSAAQKLPSR